MASATSTAGRAQSPQRRGGRGRVLAAALEQVEQFPALEVARDGLLEALGRGAPTSELAELVESDVGLAIATLHAASLRPGKEQIKTAGDAVDALGPAQMVAAIKAAPAFRPFERA